MRPQPQRAQIRHVGAVLHQFSSTAHTDSIRNEQLRKLQRQLLPLQQLRRLPPLHGVRLHHDKREINLPADARTEQSGNHQRRGECGEEPVARNAEIVRDGIRKDRRQVVARRPGESLCGPQRDDDR